MMKLFLYNDKYNFEFTDNDIVRIDVGFDEVYDKPFVHQMFLAEKTKHYHVYQIILQPENYDNIIEFRTIFDLLYDVNGERDLSKKFEIKGEITSDDELYNCALFGCMISSIENDKVVISVQYTTWKKGYEHERVSLTPKETFLNNKQQEIIEEESNILLYAKLDIISATIDYCKRFGTDVKPGEVYEFLFAGVNEK